MRMLERSDFRGSGLEAIVIPKSVIPWVIYVLLTISHFSMLHFSK
jgi:hypothetical protein